MLGESWREVKIPNFDDIPIVGEAKKYKAYEDTENKYILILSNHGKSNGNQDEITEWIERNLEESKVEHVPNGTLKYLANHSDHAFIQENSLFKDNLPVGYEFFTAISPLEEKGGRYAELWGDGKVLLGTIFEYGDVRYGLTYIRYNSTWGLDMGELFRYWEAKVMTEEEINEQIMNGLKNRNYD